MGIFDGLTFAEALALLRKRRPDLFAPTKEMPDLEVYLMGREQLRIAGADAFIVGNSLKATLERLAQ